MVNITDTFTRLYGRPPTEAEVRKMMEMKAEQELRKRLTETKPEKKPRIRMPRVNKLTRTINKLMLLKLSDKQIIDALEVTQREFRDEVERHDLPRKDLPNGTPK